MKVSCFAALAAALALPLTSSGAVLFTEGFGDGAAANWTVNDPGLTDVIVDFNYNYSAIGVPPAPNGTGTVGLKMAVNNELPAALGGFSVSPTGQSFTGDYKLEFDLWANYVTSLSGSTQLSYAGIGTSGTVGVWQNATPKESVFFAAAPDGDTSTTDYRVFSSATPPEQPTGYAPASGVYLAGTDGGAGGAQDSANAYYTSAFPLGAAPADQTALFPTQGSATHAGSIGFAWRHVTIEVAGGFATWSIDDLPIAKVDLSTVMLGGSNILFGMSDINAGMSNNADRALLNVALIDNVVVTQIIPEPATLGLVAMGLGLAAAARRRV